MTAEVRLSARAAEIVARIRRLDAELDAVEKRSQEDAIGGLHAMGALVGSASRLRRRDARDREQEELLVERADLVAELKKFVSESSTED